MTTLGRALRRAFQLSGARSQAEWCEHLGVKQTTVRGWMRDDVEPHWLRTLRTIKRRMGLTWDELLDGKFRVARRVIVSNHATDCATGHCECSACGGAIDPWDKFCRHCGTRLEGE